MTTNPLGVPAMSAKAICLPCSLLPEHLPVSIPKASVINHLSTRPPLGSFMDSVLTFVDIPSQIDVSGLDFFLELQKYLPICLLHVST